MLVLDGHWGRMQLASDKAGRSSHNYVQLRGFELETSAPVSATIGTGSSYHLIDGLLLEKLSFMQFLEWKEFV